MSKVADNAVHKHINQQTVIGTSYRAILFEDVV